MKQLKVQSGYTMIESIAFLGIVIMLGVAVLTLISRMQDKFKISRIGQQVIELQKAIDYRYSSAANYQDLDVHDLIDEKLPPNDMVVDNNLYHSFGGPVVVRPNGDNYSYRIEFHNLPKDPCVELAVQEWSDKHTAHLLTIKVNSAKFSWNGTPSRMLPVNITQAELLCTSGGRNNTIVWQFQ